MTACSSTCYGCHHVEQFKKDCPYGLGNDDDQLMHVVGLMQYMLSVKSLITETV